MPRTSTASPALRAPRTTIADDLLAWYDGHRRDLPWRARPGVKPDPYAVWLSEIMLQQTTVRAVAPYYARFLAQWPTVGDLAAAASDSVMRAWAGLGYYTRARNLHACAIAVARDHAGRFPDTEQGLRALPGIGTYTAAAIAAIAFGRTATVVDGNVERVMARVHGVDLPASQAKPRLYELMAAATPTARAGDFAQATMDLGATVCTPRSPACILCPLQHRCVAAALGVQAELPRRAAKGKAVYRRGTAYCVTDPAGALLLRTRPPRGLLGGMVELPGTAWQVVDADAPALPVAESDVAAGRVVHVFTHFTLLLDVVVSPHLNHLPGEAIEGCRWVPRDLIDSEALPTLMRHAIALGRAKSPEQRD